ncbi:nucleotide-binding protein [Streptomyces roseolus]|uniref:nucleotide-binding protein n=1 Tax=Streptomyces roseolus TaxID=67358 RepID=UPI0037B0C3A9
MPIAKGGRPKYPNLAALTADLVADRFGAAHDITRSQVRGKTTKTTTSIELAQLLAQRGGNRVLLVDLDPAPSATMEDIDQLQDELGQRYDPVILDHPGGPSVPLSAEVWEEARRTLGLDAGDHPTA